MRKKDILILMNPNAEQGQNVLLQWMNEYSCFVLIGQDVDLLNSVTIFLENEGKEVYVLKDIDELLTISPFSDPTSYIQHHITVSVC